MFQAISPCKFLAFGQLSYGLPLLLQIFFFNSDHRAMAEHCSKLTLKYDIPVLHTHEKSKCLKNTQQGVSAKDFFLQFCRIFDRIFNTFNQMDTYMVVFFPSLIDEKCYSIRVRLIIAH